MDTRTRSASPAQLDQDKTLSSEDKISAYYSLVFPHFTFYIQTLSVTIGRRCVPNPGAATSSTAEPATVDVDLGALKSVSRLHAKIEFDQEEDRFVLVVIGRNGAWVDGVWSAAGTRAPLGERSQIQIASRTFHFVLPPPPPPEDTPSPSSQSSINLPRSPSLDITSISPPSSQPSHTPPPSEAKVLAPPPDSPTIVPPLKPTPLLATTEPQLPNSNSIGKSSKTGNSKKRKKVDDDTIHPRPKPEDMPPKPPFTYAQLIYRAIKAIGDKATLQEICSWIMSTYEYYRYAEAGWTSSVRHNLSSSRAFLKLERCGGDRGKGFFWTLDGKHSQSLEEQEAKILQAAATGPQGGKDGNARGRKKEKGQLEPALKRSVKGDIKGGPLPPPLTSSPLPFKTSSTASTVTAVPNASPNVGRGNTTPGTSGIFAYPTHPHPSNVGTIPSGNATPSGLQNPYASLTQSWAVHSVNASSSPASVNTAPLSPPLAATSSTSSTGPSSQVSQLNPPPSGVPDVIIPIILGPIPPTHLEYSPTHLNNSAKEGYMVVHDKKLILDPGVFAGLAKEKLEELEKMGTRAALPILTEHMVKVLKRRRAKERGKGRKRGTGKKDEGACMAGGLFTTAPLEPRKATGVVADSDMRMDASSIVNEDTKAGVAQVMPPVHITIPVPDPVPVEQEDIGSPIVVVDDSDDDGPSAKRRKVGNGVTV